MNDSEMHDGSDVPSSALDLSLTSFYRSGTLSSSASNLIKTADSASSSSSDIPSHYHDFLSLLAICQTREIDLVGITWDRALDDNSNLIGLGLTSEIRPGTLNLDFTFAFKRLTDSNYAQAAMASDQQRRHRAYEALVSEISVLGHPIIRNHENIIRLEGVCWDFLPSSSEEKVRPVLIFEKAKYGDLGRFMSTHGQGLTWQQKIRLCSNIVRGLATMHSCGIVHGDIKPHNVLVFQQPDEEHKDQEGNSDEYVAKLADFGYSTCTRMKTNTLGSNSVVLPWSPPWNAPEVSADNHTLSTDDAKLSDIFSVGVICLWLLFMDNAPKEAADSSKRGYNWLSVLKAERKLKVFALECLDDSTHLTSPEKNAMKMFFELTLSPDSCKRSADLHHLLILLNSEDDRNQSHDVPMIPDAEDDFSAKKSLFELPRSIIQFVATDFRLRQYIITCLQMDALTCGDQICRENAAFQLAFCYKTGFGCQKDDLAVLDALKKSGKSTDDLDLMIQVAFYIYQPYKNVQLRRLVTEGYIHVIDFANEYRNLGLLQSSEVYYKREIHDLEITFPNEYILFRLKIILADILDSQGKYDEQESLLRDMIERADSDVFQALYKVNLDLEEPRTRLATAYLNRGLYEQAIEIFQESLARTENKIGKHHPQSLSTSINFASALQQLGHYDAAESLTRECLLQYERILGSDHPSTLNTLGSLAALLFKQNHVEKALEIMQKVALLDKKWFGPDHHSTLISLNNVAVMQGAARDYEGMELTTRLVWQKMLNLLGPEHPHTCTSLATYGNALFHQKKFDAAATALRQAVDSMRKARGKDHHDVVALTNSLAMILLGLNQTEEVRQLMQSLLDNRNSRVIKDLKILKQFGWIGEVLAARRLFDIAEQLLHLAIEGEESVLDKSAKQTISHLSSLATILLEREKFAEAEVVSRAALERCAEHTDDEMISFGSRNNLAAALDLQEKFEESIEIHSQSLRTCERLLGPLHRNTLTCVNNLGAALSGQRRYSEAEAFYRRAFEGYRDSLGSEHEDTLGVANNLATAITNQGRYEEAAHLYREILETLTKNSGADHFLVQQCRKNLDLVISWAEG